VTFGLRLRSAALRCGACSGWTKPRSRSGLAVAVVAVAEVKPKIGRAGRHPKRESSRQSARRSASNAAETAKH
jgi:hypothetical protein